MQTFTERVAAVLDHRPIQEPNLEKAIKVAAVIQGLRYTWSPETDEWIVKDDPEMTAVLQGRVFPTIKLTKTLLMIFDCAKELPVPRTDEVMELYSFFSREKNIFQNGMCENLAYVRKKNDMTEGMRKQIIKKERNHIMHTLVDAGIIDSTTFRKLVG
jgi:hypothetical protein